MKKHIPITILALCGCLAAHAQIINVNYTSGNGPGGSTVLNTNLDGTAYSAGLTPISYTGSTWNNLTGIGDQNGLLDSDGVATTVGYTIDGGGNSGPGFNFSLAGPTATTPLLYNYNAPTNGFGPPLAGPLTISFNGLNPSNLYRFVFVAQGDTAGQGSDFTIGGTTLTSAGSDPSAALTDGVNFVSFTNISSDGSGNLDVTWNFATGGDDGFAVLNGFQIAVVPEPGTYAIAFGLGALAFVAIRRRRKA